MIRLDIPKSQLELDLEAIEAPLTLLDNKINAAIGDLNDSLRIFWSLPDDRLLAILNNFGPVKMQQIFESHYRYAVGFNQYATDRGLNASAIDYRLRDDIGFNPETMQFFIIPPPTPAPDPEPEPVVPTEPQPEPQP